jgi:hypothetical protein
VLEFLIQFVLQRHQAHLAHPVLLALPAVVRLAHPVHLVQQLQVHHPAQVVDSAEQILIVHIVLVEVNCVVMVLLPSAQQQMLRSFVQDNYYNAV